MNNDRFAELLLKIENHPQRDAIVRGLSMEMLKMRMKETFEVLVGSHVDYLVIFVDPESNHAASLSNMTHEETVHLVSAWVDINLKSDEP